jgi:DNA polymerase
MVKAPAGKKLIVCDFAGIEARVLAWLAGQKDLVEIFRAGEDVYKVMAGKIYNKPPELVTKAERQLGKVAILGLGYQMGWSKFITTAKGYGISLDDAFAQQVVETYRTTYKRIRSFWRNANDAAICAVQGSPVSIGRIRYFVEDRWLFCQLPCGRRSAYTDPQVRDEETPWGKKPQLSYMTVDSMTKKWVRQRTYGGMLVENIVQATARDFLVEAMFRLEKAGYPTIMHVHDETVSEVDADFGSAREVEEIMSFVPEWGKGCPIAAEGFETERYRK